MRQKSVRACLLLGMASLLFASGVAIGQGTGRSKMDKYLVRSEQTELDRQFQSIQIEEMQSELNQLEELEVPNRTSIPTFALNPKTRKIFVLLTVHGNWVEKTPLGMVEKTLKAQAQETIAILKFHMREISDADVEISFSKVNLQMNEIVNGFAKYENGELTILH